jgi:excisionase family DNA binding protein
MTRNRGATGVPWKVFASFGGCAMVETTQSGRLMYRIREIAKLCGVSERTIRNWMRYRKFPYKKIGKMPVFIVKDVMQWLENNIEGRH